jgi:hypothetical protein
LEPEHPSAAEGVREGLDETLTVLTLNLSARLRRSPATTNARGESPQPHASPTVSPSTDVFIDVAQGDHVRLRCVPTYPLNALIVDDDRLISRSPLV